MQNLKTVLKSVYILKHFKIREERLFETTNK